MGTAGSYEKENDNEIIESLTKEEKEEKQIKRTYIAKEILATENSYVNSISSAIENWEVFVILFRYVSPCID
jgi:hypothetical protein